MANVNGANSSSSSSSTPSTENPRKDIEEVWKDISLSNLQQDMPSSPTLTLDNNNQTFKNTSAKPTTTSTPFRGMILQDFLSGPLIKDSSSHYQFSHPSYPAATLTAFKLNTGHFLSSYLSPTNMTACAMKRPAQEPLNENGKGDHRKKKMIKNRESAARSRARKQAYTNELELEVAHLAKENKKLRRKYEELLIAMTAETTPVTKRKLQRTFTAPF